MQQDGHEVLKDMAKHVECPYSNIRYIGLQVWETTCFLRFCLHPRILLCEGVSGN